IVHRTDRDAVRRGRGRPGRARRAAPGGPGARRRRWIRRAHPPDRRAAVRHRPRHGCRPRPAADPDRAAPSPPRGPVPRSARGRGGARRTPRPAREPGPAMTAPNPPAAAVSRTGSIYDLGYRRYEGPRLRRAYAVRSMIVHSFRTTYGLGRGGRAKIAPLVLGGLAVLPAVLVVGALTLAARLGVQRHLEGASPISYESYFSSIGAIIALFCAAQAPELFGRDQRHGVLTLYFGRALRRTDYALARLAGFALALLLLLLFPMAILFIGRGLLSTDIAAPCAGALPKVPAIIG